MLLQNWPSGVLATYKGNRFVIPLSGSQAFKLLAIDAIAGRGRQTVWAGLEIEIPGALEIRATTPIQSAPTHSPKPGRLSFTAAGCFIQVSAPNGSPRQLDIATWNVDDYEEPDFATDQWSLVAVAPGRAHNVVAPRPSLAEMLQADLRCKFWMMASAVSDCFY